MTPFTIITRVSLLFTATNIITASAVSIASKIAVIAGRHL